MTAAAVTLSIDLELAWGNWDNLQQHQMEHIERSERLPERTDGLVNLPASLLFLGREGIRRFVPSSAMRLKLAKGVSAAARRSQVFHVWFHPSNFWHDPETQFATFDEFASGVAQLRDLDQISVKPMAAFA